MVLLCQTVTAQTTPPTYGYRLTNTSQDPQPTGCTNGVPTGISWQCGFDYFPMPGGPQDRDYQGTLELQQLFQVTQMVEDPVTGVPTATLVYVWQTVATSPTQLGWIGTLSGNISTAPGSFNSFRLKLTTEWKFKGGTEWQPFASTHTPQYSATKSINCPPPKVPTVSK